jgi:peptidoglycan LD-endopeptidase LytH
MKRLFYLLILTSLYSFSCGSSSKGLFSKRTPHEAYAEKLDDKGLDKTPEGRAWLSAAELALQQPQAVNLPFALKGYFPADKPRAIGWQLQGKPGTRIEFDLAEKISGGMTLYADLFYQTPTGTEHVMSVDTASRSFSYEVEKEGTYILRLQPELNQSGEYTLTVNSGPALGFPVSDSKAYIGSVWGDDRDGGKRRHEGIDIFAKKGSPAVAAADGYITGVREGGIGGKVVWLRPEGKNYTLYYAHLDSQSVQEGQTVKKGDVLGTVGNTGNARFTPAHLHFGIYTFGGPVDPILFVRKNKALPPKVPQKELSRQLVLTRQLKAENGAVTPATTVVTPLAATAEGFIAELPDGSLAEVGYKMVKEKKGETQVANQQVKA